MLGRHYEAEGDVKRHESLDYARLRLTSLGMTVRVEGGQVGNFVSSGLRVPSGKFRVQNQGSRVENRGMREKLRVEGRK